MISRRCFVGAVSVGPAIRLRAAKTEPVRFGVIADVQYADQDTAGRRTYRESMPKLEAAVQQFNSEHPVFTIHLGDLVDGGVDNFDRIDGVFRKVEGKRYYVLGNHDFFGTRDSVLRKFGLARGYYSFEVKPWRFVVLDGMNVSVKGGWGEDTPNFKKGTEMLAALKQQKARNAYDWNGAVGDEQREWLKRELATAAERKEQSIVFCHFPTVAAACRPEHLLWDHAEVLSILEASPSVAAYINGHDHHGGYAYRNGIHHVTMPGVVENDIAKSVRVCDAYPDRLVLRRPGEREGQVLELERRNAARHSIPAVVRS